MAVAYGSISNSGWQISSTAVVTKPSGLAVGDIMIAYCAGDMTSFPTGFTSIGSTTAGGNNYKTNLGYKVADSSDVAATNFTFTLNGATTNICVLVRVTGSSVASSTIVSSGALVSNTATPSITGLTPYSRGDILLFQFWHGSDAVTAVSSYAIATSNPTWTEILDTTAAGGNAGCGIAYATRSQLTATGNFSAAGGNASTDWGGWLISFSPSLNFSTAESVTLTENHKQNQTIKTSESVTLTDEEDIEIKKWNNINKNVSTWNNIDKS